MTLIPTVVSKKDMPVIIGAVTQVRVLGGTIGLAICTSVLNGFVKKRLRRMLSQAQIEEISQSLQDIRTLTPEQQEFVRRTFAQGYSRQMKVLLAFSALVFLSSLLLLEKKPRRVAVEELRREDETAP